MIDVYKSKLRKQLETQSLRQLAKIYGVTYERIRQICVEWGLDRRKWQKINRIDDEKGGEK